MADEPTAADPSAPAQPPAARAKPRRPDAPRVFEKMVVRLVRMGREVAVYHGAYGTYDAKASRVVLHQGRVELGPLELTATRLSLDLPANRLAASGAVKITEGGVKLETERFVSAPSLTRFEFGGGVVIHAKDKDSARALLDSGLV